MDLTEQQLEALEQMETKKKVGAADFSLQLEKYVREYKQEYIPSLMYFCEVYDIDREKVGNYLTDNIKKRIAKENNIMDSVYHINTALPV